jgi:hypothetical protein
LRNGLEVSECPGCEGGSAVEREHER